MPMLPEVFKEQSSNVHEGNWCARTGWVVLRPAAASLRLAIHSLRYFALDLVHILTYARTSHAFTSPSITFIIVVVLLAE